VVGRSQNGTGGIDAGMTKKDLQQKILKEYLGINMRILNDNTKMDAKK
jgi:hypothetical protein